ncbi:MAG: hypothetical protein II661_09680 [Bacteroidales bacterium]|nr:hypothetical protein [Bacteroidales bacterium]
MQNNIFNYALKTGEINREVLCEMCDQMDAAMRARFVEAVLGIIDVSNIEIPQTSINNHRGERVFKSYNYLQDVVTYTYKETVRRYFKEQEKAEKYTQTGSCSYSDYECREQGDFTIAAEYVFDREDTCSLYSWNNPN